LDVDEETIVAECWWLCLRTTEFGGCIFGATGKWQRQIVGLVLEANYLGCEGERGLLDLALNRRGLDDAISVAAKPTRYYIGRSGRNTPRKDKNPCWAQNMVAPKEDVVTLLKLIPEELGPTPETTALADRTNGMHVVAKDLSSEVETNEDRTTRLELDVGECTVESDTRSLLQQATATMAENVLCSMFTKIDRMEHELRVALETSAEDTHNILAQLG
jgi:hypothetical protein